MPSAVEGNASEGGHDHHRAFRAVPSSSSLQWARFPKEPERGKALGWIKDVDTGADGGPHPCLPRRLVDPARGQPLPTARTADRLWPRLPGTLLAMAAVCQMCGKHPSFGMSISHSHRRTKRRWDPNIQRVRAIVNGSPRRLHVCTSCIKAGRVTKPSRSSRPAPTA